MQRVRAKKDSSMWCYEDDDDGGGDVGSLHFSEHTNSPPVWLKSGKERSFEGEENAERVCSNPFFCSEDPWSLLSCRVIVGGDGSGI